MSFLDLHELSVRYPALGGGPETMALDGVSLSVAAGEVVAVVGPSGCGKSTLLRAVAGLEPLSGGSIALEGRDLDRVPTHHRDLGLMFQDHALFPHLTVAENVAFGLKMKQAPGSERQARAEELLALVGLAGFGERTVDQLSGGEAQRVALARAVAPSPRLLMLDEPLGSLDRVLREQLTADLRRLITGLGVTALHVTHDQAEAFALADRIVVLRAGRVEQVGAPVDLWREPANVFVAEFLGHPNIWHRPDGTILVPVPALTLLTSDEGAMLPSTERRTGSVELVEFREGRFRLTAVSTDDVPGERLVFESADALAVGAPVVLAVGSWRQLSNTT